MRPALLAMIHALDPAPALIHGPHLEVLGINRAGKLLLDDFDAMPPTERNTARWMFLNPRARIVYLDWPEIAAGVVAVLRAAAMPGVPDPALTALVDDLTARSPEFARLWSGYELSEHTHGVKRFFHESAGEMRISYETMLLPGSQGQTVLIYSADAARRPRRPATANPAASSTPTSSAC
ncbi:hypothetical protein Ahu01nite_093120 [Winogradskya humida]|uniref:MmyB-like transcription regulator ligand binding domain-containing protein n=1 Tax=Winogradskya humida TaxID=113566 RepID=A0ABQ4A5T9_9ACTN|nr:hypothetical protein Ahu01nite_093120 [Actinoplanes humidus]